MFKNSVSVIPVVALLAAVQVTNTIARPASVAEAVAWLENESDRLIRASRRTMKDGMAAFPPRVGIGYEAFWLRDFAYTLEGSINSYSGTELRDACRLFVHS